MLVGGAVPAVAVTDAPVPDGRPSTGSDLERARDAALDDVGQGTVTGEETDDDEEAAYQVEARPDTGEEVEVVLDDAAETEVELGSGFRVVQVEAPEHDD